MTENNAPTINLDAYRGMANSYKGLDDAEKLEAIDNALNKASGMAHLYAAMGMLDTGVMLDLYTDMATEIEFILDPEGYLAEAEKAVNNGGLIDTSATTTTTTADDKPTTDNDGAIAPPVA